MLKTDRDWQELAKIDPLWAVATWPGKENAWVKEDFYAVGESDTTDAIIRWKRYEPALGGVCVEIGCGAGRLTRTLVRHFDRVIGVDVSQEMIQLAEEAAPTAEFVLVSGTEIPLESDLADAVFTAHVLQHLEGIENVTRYFEQMHRVLRSGGTLMAHTDIGPLRPRWRKTAATARMWSVRKRLWRGRDVRHFHGERYPAAMLRGRLHRVGFTDVELVEFEMRSNHDPHPFWLARKSTRGLAADELGA